MLPTKVDMEVHDRTETDEAAASHSRASQRVPTGFTPPKSAENNGSRKRAAIARHLLAAKRKGRAARADCLPPTSAPTKTAWRPRTASATGAVCRPLDGHSTDRQSVPSHDISQAEHIRQIMAGPSGPVPQTAPTRGGASSSVSIRSGFTSQRVGISATRMATSSKTAILSSARLADPLLNIMSTRSDNRQLNDALLVAAERGDVAAVTKCILQGAKTSGYRSGLNQYTALHYAASRGHLACVERLVYIGRVPLNEVSSDGETALHAASYAGFETIVEFLIDHGADVDMADKYGETALFYAARQERTSVVRLLVQRGADVKHRDNLGDTVQDACPSDRVRSFLSREPRAAAGGVADSPGSHVEVLPGTVLTSIFGMMDVKDLGRASCVNTTFHRISTTRALWQALGCSRWELALRGAMRTQQGGASFALAPVLSNYNTHLARVTRSNESVTRPKSADSYHVASPKQRAGAAPKPMLGLSLDMFEDDEDDEYVAAPALAHPRPQTSPVRPIPRAHATSKSVSSHQ